MSNVQSVITEFSAKLEAAIRADALAQITAQLGGEKAPVLIGEGHLRAAIRANAKSPLPARKPARGGGGKRTPAQIAKTQEAILGALADKKGHSAEQIKAALGVDLKTIELPIAKLLAAKSIKKNGQKRATRYFKA